MAPKYPVFTQNSNSTLKELRKLEGFGTELEALIGEGSAADGITASDVAGYLKEIGAGQRTLKSKFDSKGVLKKGLYHGDPGLLPGASDTVSNVIAPYISDNPEFFVAAIGDSDVYNLINYDGAADQVVNKAEVRTFSESNDPVLYLQSGSKGFNNMCLCKLESDGHINTKATVGQAVGKTSAVSSLFWNQDLNGDYTTEKMFHAISEPVLWFSADQYTDVILANEYNPNFKFFVGPSNPPGYTEYIEVDKELPTKWVITQTGANPQTRLYPDRVYYKLVENTTPMNLRMFITHCAGTLGAYEGRGQDGLNSGGFDAKNPDDTPDENGVRPETVSRYGDTGNSHVVIYTEEHLKSYVLNQANINALKNGVLVGNTYQPDPRLPNYRDIGVVRPNYFNNPNVDVTLENLFASGLTTYNPGHEYDYTQNGNIIPFVEYMYNRSVNPSLTGPNDAGWKFYQDIFNDEFAQPLGLTSTFFYIDSNSYLNSNISSIQSRFVKPRTFSSSSDSLAYDASTIAYNGTPARFGGPIPRPVGLYSEDLVPIETEDNSIDLMRFVDSYSYIKTIKYVAQPGAWMFTCITDQAKMLAAITSGKDSNGNQFYNPQVLKEWKSPNFQQVSLNSLLTGNQQRSSSGFGSLSVSGFVVDDVSDFGSFELTGWGGGNLTSWGFNVTSNEWIVVNRNVGPGRLSSVPVTMILDKFKSEVNLFKGTVRPTHLNSSLINSQLISNMEEFVQAVDKINEARVDPHIELLKTQTSEITDIKTYVENLKDLNFVPVELSFSGIVVPEDYITVEFTEGQLPIRNYKSKIVDAFVSMYNIDGISTEWIVDFINTPLDNGAVINIDNILYCPSAVFDNSNRISNLDLMTTKIYSAFSYECDLEIVGTGNAASLTFDVENNNYSYIDVRKVNGVPVIQWKQASAEISDSGLTIGEIYRLKLYGYDGKFIALLTDTSDNILSMTANSLSGGKPLGIKANPNVKLNAIKLSSLLDNNQILTEWTQAYLTAYTYARASPVENQAFPPQIWENNLVSATGADTEIKVVPVTVGGETRYVQMHITTPTGVTLREGIMLRGIRQGSNWNSTDFTYENIPMEAQLAVASNRPCVSFYLPGQNRFDLPSNGIVKCGFIEEALTAVGFPATTKIWIAAQTGGAFMINVMLHNGDFDNYNIMAVYYGAPGLTAPWNVATTYTDTDSGLSVTSNVPVPDDKSVYNEGFGYMYYLYYLSQPGITIEERLRAYLIQMKTYGQNPNYVDKNSMKSIIQDICFTIANGLRTGGFIDELKDSIVSQLQTSRNMNVFILQGVAVHAGITDTTTVEEAIASLVGNGPNALFDSGSTIPIPINGSILHDPTKSKTYVSWTKYDRGSWVYASETSSSGSPTENSLTGLVLLDEVEEVPGIASGNVTHFSAANWSVKKPLEDGLNGTPGLADGILFPIWPLLYWPKYYTASYVPDTGYVGPWSDIVITQIGVDFIEYAAFLPSATAEQKETFKTRYGVRAGKRLTEADAALLDTSAQYYSANYTAAVFSDPLYTINSSGVGFIDQYAPVWLSSPWKDDPEYLDSFKSLYSTVGIKLLQSDYDKLSPSYLSGFFGSNWDAN